MIEIQQTAFDALNIDYANETPEEADARLERDGAAMLADEFGDIFPEDLL